MLTIAHVLLPYLQIIYYDLKRQCQRECHWIFNNYISSLVDLNNNQVTMQETVVLY